MSRGQPRKNQRERHSRQKEQHDYDLRLREPKGVSGLRRERKRVRGGRPSLGAIRRASGSGRCLMWLRRSRSRGSQGPQQTQESCCQGSRPPVPAQPVLICLALSEANGPLPGATGPVRCGQPLRGRVPPGSGGSAPPGRSQQGGFVWQLRGAPAAACKEH